MLDENPALARRDIPSRTRVATKRNVKELIGIGRRDAPGSTRIHLLLHPTTDARTISGAGSQDGGPPERMYNVRSDFTARRYKSQNDTAPQFP
jgi:hypothetical protein